MKIYLPLIISSCLLFGCSDKNETGTPLFNETEMIIYTPTNPTVAEIPEYAKKADLFLWHDIVYQTNIAWMNELTFSDRELVGVIQRNTLNPNEFTHLSANILSIGTEIYAANERNDILIAKHEGEVHFYYKLVEG